MFMGLGMPIPDLSNKPGPGRPGWGPTGTYDFQFEVTGAVTIKANAAGAGNFRVNWPDGTTQVLSGDNASVAAPNGTAGIVSINNEELDTTYANEFAVVGGKANVSKVVSWGANPWSIVEEAFKDCVNLTDISTTSFIAGTANVSNQPSGCIMYKMFLGCTSLLEVDIRKWDLSTSGASWRLGGPFANLANLQKLDATGLKIKFFDSNNVSTGNFTNIGTNVADGCEFKMAGLDMSTSSTGYLDSFFAGTKFKSGSNLSNWKFPVNFNPAGWRGFSWFSNCILNDGILDISGWTTWPGESFPGFSGFNSALTSQGTARVDLSNFGLTNVNNFQYVFNNCKLKEVIGFNTWGACAGNTNMFGMFSSATLMRINPNDNFSDTFVASLNPSNLKNAFNSFGSALLDSERGVAMNFKNIDFSNAPSFDSTWRSAKLLDAPDFSTAIFDNNNPVSFPTTFRSFNALNTDSSFVLNGGKVTSFGNTFYGATINTVNINDGVDLSALTYVGAMFYYANVTTATLPSNADYSSLTGFSIWISGFSGFSVCQGDILMRRLKATNLNTNITATLPKITESPALVSADRDVLENDRGWNITTATPDATLPFAYPAYMVDPSSTTSLTPSLLPPVADRNFSSTNAGVTVDQNTGVLSWASNFEGFTTVRCTYADGCYNEVSVGVQVPTVLRRLIPAAGQTALFGFRGNQYIDWGDGTTETNSGGASHAYAAAGTGWGVWRTIKIFDKSETEKFTGFTSNGNNYDRIDIMKFGSQVFDFCRFTGMYALGLRAEANNALNTTGLTNFESMFVSDSSYKSNARFADPNNSLGSWKTSTATGGGAITSFKNMFNGTGTLGRTILNDHSDFTWSFPAGTTATAGTYTGTIYGRNQSGTYTDYTIRWLVKVEGSGTVTLDNNNFQAIPNYMYTGRNMSVGDVIRIDAGAFGSLNNNITLTLTSDNILNPNQTPANFNNWDTSQVTDFSSMFNHNSSRTGGNRGNTVNFSNWNLASAENFSGFAGTGNPGGLGGTDLAPKNVSAADSPTGSAYIAWDTSNVTNFSSFGLIGTNHLGILKYWRFNTTSNFSMSSMFYNINIQQYISDEPCKTQTIAANDPNNPFGVAYTAWNMEKCSNLAQFAYRQTSPPGLQVLTPALSSWQISDSLTSFHNMSRAYSGGFTFTPTVGQWDPSGLTGNQYWHTTRSGQAWKFSTSAYDNLLDITNGWGAHASTVNSGVSLNMGTSKYSPGNPLAVQRGNVGTPSGIPAGQMFVYDANVVLKDLTNVGDIVQLMNGGSSYGEFAKITGYLATDDRVAFVDVLGGAGFPVNWPGITWQYQIYDSDAAKGRYALLEAGWTITDGGVDITFESAEIEIEIAPGQETFTIGTHGYMSTKIDWGDGNGFINNPATNQPYTSYINSFTYPTTGQTEIYRVKIRENDTETFNGWRFGQYGDKARVRKIIAWGSQVSTTYYQAFEGADLNKAGFTNTLPVDANGKVTKPTWVSSITTFARAFRECNMPANADWSNWSTGIAATDLSLMFHNNTNFTGTGLSNWNLSKVTNISSFVAGTAFNSDISGWDLSSCIYANGLFSSTSFNHSSIANLNLHNITHIVSMFENNTAFNQDVDTKVVGTGANAYLAWDTANVNDMHACFNGATSFNYSIGKWKIDLTSTTGLASFFKGVGTNVTGGYTHDLLTKDVTIGTGTPVAKTYVAWDVSSVNGFGSSNINYPTSMGMFQGGKFNGDITNWDMSGLGQIGAPTYGYAGEWSKMFRENSLFNQDISRKTITNVSGKGTYTAWGMSNWTGGQDSFYQASAFDQNIGNWALNTSDTSNRSMTQFFRMAGISSANYTDSFTGWANTAKTNNGFPKNKQFPFQSRYGMTPIPVFDTTRTSGITAFTVNTAGRARSYLTLDVTISNGASSVNGVYFYDFANDKWVKETDSAATIEWNTEESTWDVSYEGVVQHNGTGGSEEAGPESSTSWSGGISVVDSSLGWSISDDIITT